MVTGDEGDIETLIAVSVSADRTRELPYDEILAEHPGLGTGHTQAVEVKFLHGT
jgi:hypothetical protein